MFLLRIPRLEIQALAVLVLIGIVSAKAEESFDRPPNIVLVLTDDLGISDLGFSGSSFHQTPHLDRLADRGTVFTNAYASCAVCSPTRAAIQTGKAPARLGVTDWIRARFQNGVPVKLESGSVWPYTKENARKDRLACPVNPIRLELEEITIAERLRLYGFQTGYVGKWHLGTDDFYPDKQGYDINVGGCDIGHPPSYFDPYYVDSREHSAGNPAIRPDFRIATLPPRRVGEFLTVREASEAAAFIKSSAQTGRPFFLQLAHYAVHEPVMAPESVKQKYQNRLNEQMVNTPDLAKKIPMRNGKRDKSQIVNGQNNPNYAGLVESVDDAMGTVLAALDETGVADDTIVIFTSDNGGLKGTTDNFPYRDGKGSPYEGGLRVPLVISLPKSLCSDSVPKTIDLPVSSYDLVPTLLELAGRPLSEAERDRQQLDGRSFAFALNPIHTVGRTEKTNSDAAVETFSSERPLFWHFPHYREPWDPYSVVRQGKWKLIRFYTVNGYRYELYNLKNDPGEWKNVADRKPDQVKQLDEILSNWLSATGARLPRLSVSDQ